MKCDLCVTVFLGMMLVSNLVASSDDIPPEALAMYNAYLTNSTLGRIQVSGQIVDDNNQSMVGVTVERRIGKHMMEAVDKVQVDNNFSFSWTNCQSAHLVFSKEGYHSDTVKHLIITDDTSDDYTGYSIAQTNLIVSLDKVGDTVVLDPFAGVMSYAETGRWQYIVMGGGLVVSNVTSAPCLGEAVNYLHLSCATNEQGGLLLDTDGLPQEISIVSDAARIYHHSPTGRNFVDELGRMKEAPDSGYVDNYKLDMNTEHHSFYIRFSTGDGYLYGKASLGPLLVDSTKAGYRVSVCLDLLLQPNGSRNLNAIYLGL